MILAVTGHRPHHLAGGYSKTTYDNLTHLAYQSLLHMRPDRVRTGMAQGWDQACAQAAAYLSIPYTAVLPGLRGSSQDALWPRAARDQYERLLAGADDAEICPFAGAGREFLARDQQVVERGDWLLALWDGRKSGTGYTVGRAQLLGLPVWNVWREWVNG